MIFWINGPYGVGKSALAEKMHEMNTYSFIFDAEGVGNAIRENRPSSMFNGYIFEGYELWFTTIVSLLKEITSKYDGDIYIPMTLVYKDSFDKIRKPLNESGIDIKHILLESNYDVVHERILARGEEEGCWCMENIDLCLDNQKSFSDVIRIESTCQSADELIEKLKSKIRLSAM